MVMKKTAVIVIAAAAQLISSHANRVVHAAPTGSTAGSPVDAS